MQVIAYGDRVEFVPQKKISVMRGFLKGINTDFEREEYRHCVPKMLIFKILQVYVISPTITIHKRVFTFILCPSPIFFPVSGRIYQAGVEPNSLFSWS